MVQIVFMPRRLLCTTPVEVASFSFSSDYIYLLFSAASCLLFFCESGQISKGRLDFFIGGITTQNKAVLFLSASYCVSPASGGFIMVNYS